jgi:hypothetical protein
VTVAQALHWWVVLATRFSAHLSIVWPIGISGITIQHINDHSRRFDHPRFYREVRRILRPTTGVLAAWTYPLPVLNSPDHPAQVLQLSVVEHHRLLTR